MIRTYKNSIVVHKPLNSEAMILWLTENCTGDVEVQRSTKEYSSNVAFLFEREEDAIVFSLAW